MALPDLRERARLYSESRGCAIEAVPLGDGTDGAVWATTRKTAVKVFERLHNFETELACYELLQERGVTEIRGYSIPRLFDSSRELMVIEMGIVEPPYILDFGKAYFKRTRPQFSAEVIRETLDQQKELWGSHYSEIRSILNQLEALGIYHTDPKPGNIRPANWDPPLD
jgi:hypothetical protein